MKIESDGTINLLGEVTITIGNTTTGNTTIMLSGGWITEGYENEFGEEPVSANAVHSFSSTDALPRYFFIHVGQSNAKITPPPDGYPDPLPDGYIIRVNDGGSINIIGDPDPQTPDDGGGGGCNAAGAIAMFALLVVIQLLRKKLRIES